MRDVVPSCEPTEFTVPRTTTPRGTLALLGARLLGFATLLAALAFVVYAWWPR